MTLNTFTSGINTNFSTELNDNFLSTTTAIVYTGTDINTSVNNITGTTVTDEASVELSSIAASDIGSANYLIINCTARATVYRASNSGSDAYVQYKIQTKDIGGSYVDSLAYVTLLDTSSNFIQFFQTTSTFSWVHTLTNDEKTNGVQIQLFSKSYGTATSGNSSAFFTMIQANVRLSA